MLFTTDYQSTIKYHDNHFQSNFGWRQHILLNISHSHFRISVLLQSLHTSGHLISVRLMDLTFFGYSFRIKFQIPIGLAAKVTEMDWKWLTATEIDWWMTDLGAVIVLFPCYSALFPCTYSFVPLFNTDDGISQGVFSTKQIKI